MKTALINGTILDGTENTRPIEGKVILVDDDKITAIADEVPQGYETVDLSGKYILPGLINMHVHIPASGKPKKKQTNRGSSVRCRKSSTKCARIT